MIATSTLFAGENKAPSAPALFDRVAAILRDRYYDKAFANTSLTAW